MGVEVRGVGGRASGKTVKKAQKKSKRPTGSTARGAATSTAASSASAKASKKKAAQPKATKKKSAKKKPAAAKKATKKKTAGAAKKTTAKKKSAKPAAPARKAAARASSSAPVEQPRPAKKTKTATSRKKSARPKAASRATAGSRRANVFDTPAVQTADGESIRLVGPDKPLPRTRLGDKQLEQFRKLLFLKRAEVTGDMQNLSDAAMGSGEAGTMPIHMADIGSDNWEQEFALDLLANERSLVREIDEALDRIHHRTYGICLATHRPIGVARLRAKPWAKYCIEYARLRDEGRLPDWDRVR